MKYIMSACSEAHLEKLLQTDIDAFIIGEAKLSLRLPFVFEVEALLPAIAKIQQAGKEVYIDMHTMITNALLPHATELLILLADSGVNGIYFADPAIYSLAQELAPSIPLILSTETTTTNWYGVDYWADKGVQQVALAKELTKQAIRSIAKNMQNPNVALEIQVFGPLAMFHSRRALLNNYYQHLADTGSQVIHGDVTFLHDNERQNDYQIFEDASGTHIMSPKDICLVDEMKFLYNTPHVTTLKIDALGHTEAFMDDVVAAFIRTRALYEQDTEQYELQKRALFTKIAEQYAADFRGIDKGFLNKPTIY